MNEIHNYGMQCMAPRLDLDLFAKNRFERRDYFGHKVEKNTTVYGSKAI